MAQLNTRIVLRNDTAANWSSVNPVLLKGEIGMENDTRKQKMGDGISRWNALPYMTAESQVFQVEPSGNQTHIEAITAVVAGRNLVSGDIAIVKELIAEDKYSYTSYVYDNGNWRATDGNYDAENVYFNEDLTYTVAIGTLSKPSGSATLAARGRSVKQVLSSILAKEAYPSATKPSATVTLTNSGEYEVGSSFTPNYSVNFKAGSYTYGPATGIVATAYHVSDSTGAELDTQTGSFTQFTVLDSTNYKVTATVDHSAGTIPVTNIGNEYPAAKINAGTTNAANSGAVTGYRKWFIYTGSSLTTIDSTFIRNSASQGNAKNAATLSSLSIPGGTKRVMIALPAGSGYTKVLKSVIDIDGMGLEIIGNFTQKQIEVMGVDGSHPMVYNVWVAENANGLASSHYKCVIG